MRRSEHAWGGDGTHERKRGKLLAAVGVVLSSGVVAFVTGAGPARAGAIPTQCSTGESGSFSAGASCTFKGTGQSRGGYLATASPDSRWVITGDFSVSGTGSGANASPVTYTKGVTYTIKLLSGSGAVSGGDLVPA